MATVKELLNQANPNNVSELMQRLPAGNAFAQGPQFARGPVTGNVLVLPESAKARAVTACYVSAGTETGEFSPVAKGTTPATGEVSINSAGNIQFLAADAVSEAEVHYIPVEGAIREVELGVASNVATLPGGTGAVQLLEVESLAGTLTGTLAIAGRAATPTTGQAASDLAGTGVAFAAADAVTRARIKYVETPGLGNAPGSVLSALISDVT